MEYRQKSKLFLFPLLRLSNRLPFQPYNTYLTDTEKGISLEDCNLLVSYDIREMRGSPEKFIEFQNSMLLENSLFQCMYGNEDFRVYIFNMARFREDYYRVTRGEYSKLSNHIKRRIDEYWTSSVGPNKFIRRFLYPDKFSHYQQVAKELDIDVNILIKGVELYDPPNLEKETLILKNVKENLEIW